MQQPKNPDELKSQSADFDSRLEALNERLTALEVTRPPQGRTAKAKRDQERWQEQMLTLTRDGDAWGHEYLDFLRRTEPLLAQWADEDPELQEELASWRESLSVMEKSLGGG